ncbi:MAG: glycosyltransferase family 2 protein [Oleispira sp.]|nr:glycosyltransferase family 2 protein [Oleispira sp.]
MYKSHFTSVIIPALNEEQAIGKVIRSLLELKNDDDSCIIDQIIVCDNGSTDRTSNIALEEGAEVVYQPSPGYGIACLTAIRMLSVKSDIVLFIDADDSCYPQQGLALLEDIHQGFDLAIGSRVLGHIEANALTSVQRFGNALASLLIFALWKKKVTDLGPFRAIRTSSLHAIDMQDQTFGWTIEMQIKCIQHGFSSSEQAVDSKQRIGVSKISGTIKGSIGAGIGILSMIARLWLRQLKDRQGLMGLKKRS